MKRFDLSKVSGRLYRWALHTLKPRKHVTFKMATWVETKRRNKKVNPNGPCGSAACAAGHLAFDSAFRRMGITRGGAPRLGARSSDKSYNLWDLDGLSRVLGIARHEVAFITLPQSYHDAADFTKRGAVRKHAVKARILGLADQYAKQGL